MKAEECEENIGSIREEMITTKINLECEEGDLERAENELNKAIKELDEIRDERRSLKEKVVLDEIQLLTFRFEELEELLRFFQQDNEMISEDEA